MVDNQQRVSLAPPKQRNSYLEITIDALSFPTYAQLKNSQYDVCIYGPGKKEKKTDGWNLSWDELYPAPPPFPSFAERNDKKNLQVLLFVEGVKQKKFISLWSATKKCSSLKNEEQNI